MKAASDGIEKTRTQDLRHEEIINSYWCVHTLNLQRLRTLSLLESSGMARPRMAFMSINTIGFLNKNREGRVTRQKYNCLGYEFMQKLQLSEPDFEKKTY